MCYLKGFQILCSASALEMGCKAIYYYYYYYFGGYNLISSDQGKCLNAAQMQTERCEDNGVSHQ